MYVDDYDPDDEFEPVDRITVPFDNLRLSSTFGPPLTYSGRCGTASITISLRITSNCPINMYGPGCTETCIEEPDVTFCDYLGDMQCIGNFQLPNCTECLDNFQGPNCDEPTGEKYHCQSLNTCNIHPCNYNLFPFCTHHGKLRWLCWIYSILHCEWSRECNSPFSGVSRCSVLLLQSEMSFQTE